MSLALYLIVEQSKNCACEDEIWADSNCLSSALGGSVTAKLALQDTTTAITTFK